MPGRRAAADHPDIDLLADLAAGALTPDLEARVGAHVEGCDQCAELLGAAESIPRALRALPPEPMPADLTLRLDQALAAERARGQGQGYAEPAQNDLAGPITSAADPVTGEPSAAGPPPRTGELPTRRSLRAANTGGLETGSMGPAGAPASAPGPVADAPPDIPSGHPTGSTRRIQIAGRGASGPATGSTGRISTSPLSRLGRAGGEGRQGARRQAIEEQKSDRPSRLFPMLRVAASVVLVLVVGAGIFKVVTGGSGDDSASTAAGSADSAAGGAPPVLAPVLATGTDYEKTTINEQVRQLVSRSQAAVGAGDVKTYAAGPSDESAPEASVRASGPIKSGASGDLLRSNTALRACLTGIGEPDAQPVAVDLASYGGRDAAILVLPDDSGDYIVWVVGRDCTATEANSLAQLDVPSS